MELSRQTALWPFGFQHHISLFFLYFLLVLLIPNAQHLMKWDAATNKPIPSYDLLGLYDIYDFILCQEK